MSCSRGWTPRRSVAVYLDGYRYHAAPDKNRLAEDADQRARLRADGTVVFQLNWDDVNAAAGDTGGEDIAVAPYQGNAEARARTPTRRSAATRPSCRADLGNPVRTLFAFLADPDRRAGRAAPRPRWPGCCTRPCPREPGIIARTDRGGSPGAAASRGWRRPGRARPRHGRERLPGHGHPRSAGEERREPPRRVERADGARRPAGDDRGGRGGTRRRWAAWLYWGNLIQFLADGGGDGDQLAWTELDAVDPACWWPRSVRSSGCARTTRRTGDSEAEATPWAAISTADLGIAGPAWTCPGRLTCSPPRSGRSCMSSPSWGSRASRGADRV